MRNKENYNAYMRHYLKLRHRRLMRWAKKKLGGKCMNCGSIKYLEFDHINPNEKEFTISNLCSVSIKRLEKELDKCQLLCEKCHKEKHAWKHGTLAGARYCKCDLCRKVKSDYNKTYASKAQMDVQETLNFEAVGSRPT